MSTTNFLRIGLTGTIGAGKSLALSYFKKFNWKVFSCDDAVHELLEKDMSVKNQMAEAFGEQVLDSEDRIVRSQLGAIIFKDPNARETLEGILHPFVRKKWQTLISEEPLNHWVIEIPLLFEKNLEKLFDLSVCVGCAPEVQMDRLIKRGWSSDEIQSRLDSQLPLQVKASRADTVFWNDGTPQWLEAQIKYWIDHQNT